MRTHIVSISRLTDVTVNRMVATTKMICAITKQMRLKFILFDITSIIPHCFKFVFKTF